MEEIIFGEVGQLKGSQGLRDMFFADVEADGKQPDPARRFPDCSCFNQLPIAGRARRSQAHEPHVRVLQLLRQLGKPRGAFCSSGLTNDCTSGSTTASHSFSAFAINNSRLPDQLMNAFMDSPPMFLPVRI